MGVYPAGLQKKLLDLFMCFPFNNLLHQQTAIMLYFALENGTDNLLAHLLEECQLLQWVAHAPQEVKPEPRPMDERGAERPPIRAGNLGHLTLIANRWVSVHPKRVMLPGSVKQGGRRSRNTTCRSWGHESKWIWLPLLGRAAGTWVCAGGCPCLAEGGAAWEQLCEAGSDLGTEQ